MANSAGLNLNLLVVLDALLAERHVSRAGKRLGLSQPAVSNALAQLRGRLGDPLLIRTAGGMMPTARALAMIGPLREALTTLEAALGGGPTFDPASVQQTFVVAATDFVEFVLLPKLLARLAREAPGVQLQIRPWPYHRTPPALENGEADLWLGFYADVPPNHRDQKLFHDEFVCIVRRHHPEVGKRLTLKTYLRLKHILVTAESGSAGVADVALAARGLSRHVGLRMTHFLMVPPVVATTDFIAAISRRVAETAARQYPLRLLPPPLPLPRGTVGQVWHERTHTSPAHAWLRGVIAHLARDI
ncbi:MAG TPA: LysR family transcriptional regulator [Polyangia bacterium]|jgi:DNA-binding transcriptional LysR family regulator|nr:LysR family transcriptional regulator [Polyangia bacterium]